MAFIKSNFGWNFKIDVLPRETPLLTVIASVPSGSKPAAAPHDLYANCDLIEWFQLVLSQRTRRPLHPDVQSMSVLSTHYHPPSPFRLLFPILRFPILQTIYFEVFFTVKVIFHAVKNRFNHHGSTPQEFDLKFFPVLKLWIRKIQNYDRNRLKLA